MMEESLLYRMRWWKWLLLLVLSLGGTLLMYGIACVFPMAVKNPVAPVWKDIIDDFFLFVIVAVGEELAFRRRDGLADLPGRQEGQLHHLPQPLETAAIEAAISSTNRV